MDIEKDSVSGATLCNILEKYLTPHCKPCKCGKSVRLYRNACSFQTWWEVICEDCGVVEYGTIYHDCNINMVRSAFNVLDNYNKRA